MNGLVVAIGLGWSLFCFLAGGFTFSPSFREKVGQALRGIQNKQKSKDQSSEDWRQDIGLRPRRSVVSAAAPIDRPSAPQEDGDPLTLPSEEASASGPQREPQPVPEVPQEDKPLKGGHNGRMTVQEAKRMLQAKGYHVKRRRRVGHEAHEGKTEPTG